MSTPSRDLELVLEHRGFVRALARELVFDPDLAGEVEQETWLAALSNVPRDARSPRAWLAGIVRRMAWKAWRTRMRREDRELAAAREPRSVATPEELLERESLRRELVLAVVALDEPWREALIARYFDELAPADAARRLGIPLETLRTRLKRGRELLRERLRRRSDDGSHWALALVGAWRLEPPALLGLSRSLVTEVIVATAAQKTIGAAAGLLAILAALWLWRTPAATGSPEPGLAAEPSGARTLPQPESSALPAHADRAQAPLPAALAGAVPTSDEQRFGSLRLRVVWARDKTAAAGIWLRLVERGADDPYRTWRDVQTDPAGEVLVEQLAPGTVAAKCDRGESAQFQVVAGEERTGILGIQAGFDVVGTVIDLDGRPFVGAEIYVQIFGCSYEGFVVGRSASDGSFSVRGLAPRTGISVSALATGRAPTQQHLLMSETGETVKLVLSFEARGGSCSGRVLAPDGSAVPGARVVIGPELDSTSVTFSDGTVRRAPASQLARTDERGEFLIAGIAEGAQPVQIRATGFAPWKGEVAIVAGRTSRLDVSLASGAALSGVARDAEGRPLAGIEVWASSGGILDTTIRRTRADGSYAMLDLPLGEFGVTAEGGDRGFAETRLFGVSGGELRWDPVLSTGAKLPVRLVAPGSELAGWAITAEHVAQVDGFADTQITGADGRVEFVNVPDVELRLSLRAPGPHAFPRAVLEGVRAREGEVVIQPDPALVPTIHLRGRIVDPRGVPLGGARLAPVSANPKLFYPPFAVSDAATGEFDFGPLPAGDWSVQSFVAGFAPYRSPAAHVDAGVTWDFGDLQLQRGGTLVAKLRLAGAPSGSPPIVELRDANGEVAVLVVEGEYARSGLLAPGKYSLTARAPGCSTAQLELDVLADQETSVAVELRRP